MLYQKQEKIDISNNNLGTSKSLLEGEISGLKVYHHSIINGNKLNIKGDGSYIHILLLYNGIVKLISDDKNFHYSDTGIFIPYPDSKIDIQGQDNSHIIEICWKLSKENYTYIEKNKNMYPFNLRYNDAIIYKDLNKGSKCQLF